MCGACVCACMHVCVHWVYMCAHVRAVRVRVCMCVCAQGHAGMHMYMCVPVVHMCGLHACTCVCVRIGMHMCAGVCVRGVCVCVHTRPLRLAVRSPV